MRTRKRHSFRRIIFALGIALPGLLGMLVVQAKVEADEAGRIDPALQAQGTSTATSTFRPLPPTLAVSTLTDLPELDLSTPSGPSVTSLYAFVQAPGEPVERPYVTLIAFSSLPRTISITIRGYIDSQEFICTRSPCRIDLRGSARLVFAAYAESGVSSETVIASVSVTQSPDGYLVTIDSVSQFAVFTNACSIAWGVSDQANVPWDDFVQFPYELNTNKTLHTLATHLLLNGIVDASDCPAGGLSVGLNWPTACGLERASKAMLEWQNQFDEYIWLASREHGIPPKILKTVIEIESQFWPGNARFYLDEFGLGQLNQLGMDVLLRRDPSFYQSICPSVLSDCSRPYISLEPQQQAMIRGAAVRLADASCADCPYGIDLDKAKESVSLIARLLKANCQQVDAILNMVVVPDPDADSATATAAVATIAAGGDTDVTSYDDLWRFTFASYHSGLSCFQDAVVGTKKDKEPVTWENIADRFKCRGGPDYVDGFMNNLAAFDFYRYNVGDVSSVVVGPTIIPTRTPISTPTVFVSNATVRVQVFMDRNGNRTPEEGEWINAMTVLLETSSNERITQRTENGIAIFDMSGFMPGLDINVSLPGLYRSERFELPQEGEVTVTFIFEAPALPTSIP